MNVYYLECTHFVLVWLLLEHTHKYICPTWHILSSSFPSLSFFFSETFPFSSQPSSCDQTPFSRDARVYIWGSGEHPLKVNPCSDHHHQLRFQLWNLRLHFQCHPCSCFAKYIGDRRVVHGAFSIVVLVFYRNISVGAEAASLGDAGGLLLYCMFIVVLKRAENNMTLQSATQRT